eukprot:2125717-Pyramimonas_sp.AAC.1
MANRTLHNYTWSGCMVPFLWLSAVEATREALRLSLRTAGVPLNGFQAMVEWWEGRSVTTSGDALRILRGEAQAFSQRSGLNVPALQEWGYLRARLQEHLVDLADPRGWVQAGVMLGPQGAGAPPPRGAREPPAPRGPPQARRMGADNSAVSRADHRILTSSSVRILPRPIPHQPEWREIANAPPAALPDDGSVDGAAAQR